MYIIHIYVFTFTDTYTHMYIHIYICIFTCFFHGGLTNLPKDKKTFIAARNVFLLYYSCWFMRPKHYPLVNSQLDPAICHFLVVSTNLPPKLPGPNCQLEGVYCRFLNHQSLLTIMKVIVACKCWPLLIIVNHSWPILMSAYDFRSGQL